MRKDLYTERPRSHPSELAFDRALVGSAGDEFTSHLTSCPACRDRFAHLQEEHAALASSAMPVRVAELVASRPHPFITWLRKKWMFPVATFAAATACVLVFMRAPGGELRTKGAPIVEIYVKRGTSAPAKWNGTEALREGDAVQLAYRSAGAGRMVSAFSVEKDCRAMLELSAPASEQALIPRSWILNGTAGKERLYLAFADRTISANDFSRALHAVPHGCDGSAAPDVATSAFTARGVALRPTP